MTKQKGNSYQYYTKRAESQESINEQRRLAILILGAVSNFYLWQYLKQQRENKKKAQMSAFEYEQKRIYIDKNTMAEMQISAVELR